MFLKIYLYLGLNDVIYIFINYLNRFLIDSSITNKIRAEMGLLLFLLLNFFIGLWLINLFCF